MYTHARNVTQNKRKHIDINMLNRVRRKNTGDVEKETDYDLIQVLDHYSNSKETHFNVEFRPTSKKLPNGEWNANPNRLWPEDSWTSIKRVEV